MNWNIKIKDVIEPANPLLIANLSYSTSIFPTNIGSNSIELNLTEWIKSCNEHGSPGNEPLTKCSSNAPSRAPTTPSLNPTTMPSQTPIIHPTTHPTNVPSVSPTLNPTTNPTHSTHAPSASPSTYRLSLSPSFEPTQEPTNLPTENPSISPTMEPTRYQFDDFRMTTVLQPCCGYKSAPVTENICATDNDMLSYTHHSVYICFI